MDRAPREGARARARPTRPRVHVDEALVYRAIADPTRRRILRLLAEGDRTVHALAEGFDMSRPAVSKHLAVLLRAGLVSERKVGRERHYRLEGEPLREVVAWMDELDRFWTTRLQALGEELDRRSGGAGE